MSTLEEKFRTIRDDFPRLKTLRVYLDSAATTHKPKSVISALSTFYQEQYGTVHRAVYSAAQEATQLYNEARLSITSFINAQNPCEVIFTRGTTDSLNIIADSMAKGILKPHDKILISEMEHHANIVPWQLAAERSGAILEVLPVTNEGAFPLDSLKTALDNGNVRVVSITHGSNVLGTVTPIKEIARLVHEAGALLVVDGAQTAGHLPIDVQDLGCDFFCASSHKMCGPTGVGLLWGKESLLEKLPPTRGGGDMIDQVFFEKSTWNDLPLKFEPGTPPIAEAIGFGAAITYLTSIGMDSIKAWEDALFSYFLEKVQDMPYFHRIGTCTPRCALQSFYVEGMHPLDLATLLDLRGIAVRSGSMCAQPILRRYNLREIVRASFAFYNTKEDVDALITAISQLPQKPLST